MIDLNHNTGANIACIIKTVLGIKPNNCPSGWETVCQDIFGKVPSAGIVQKLPEQRDKARNHTARNDTDVVELVREYANRRKANSEVLGAYLAVDNPDYQPISFLERALRLSACVCRITRSYPLKDLSSFIQAWKPQDVPEICKVLEGLLEKPGSILSWGDFWKTQPTFQAAFDSNELKEQINNRANDPLSIPHATGFLVGKSYLLTNCHVLNEEENGQDFDQFRAQFRYERNLNNQYDRQIRPIEYKLDPSFCFSCPDLDFTLIKLEEFPDLDSFLQLGEKFPSELERKREQMRRAKLSFEQAGENFGWLWLDPKQVAVPYISRSQINDLETQLKAAKIDSQFIDDCKLHGIQGEPVCIIQHPRGRSKEIVLFNSSITKGYKNFIHYTTDTDLGSSGSPILNADLKLVGLHYGALISYTKDQRIEVKANVGTKTSSIIGKLRSILEQLKIQSYPEKEPNPEKARKLDGFIKEYIDRTIPNRQRRIFLLSGKEKNLTPEEKLTRVLVEKIVEKNQKDSPVKFIDVLQDMTFYSQEARAFYDNLDQRSKISVDRLRLSSDPSLPLKIAIAWINNICDRGEKDNNITYSPGDVALEILTSAYSQPPNPQVDRDALPQGVAAYYISDNRERRAHAELILDRLSEKIPELRSRGALSDINTETGSLMFCRDVYMPSIVLSLGFLENAKDREVLGVKDLNNLDELDEAKVQRLADALHEALVVWSDALNPVPSSNFP
jgi:hypothetical protein